jgi:hypothetical protein
MITNCDPRGASWYRLRIAAQTSAEAEQLCGALREAGELLSRGTLRNGRPHNGHMGYGSLASISVIEPHGG